MRKGKQTDLARALDALSRRLDRRGGGRYLQERAARAWESVAGPMVTSHTTRAHLRGGELVVFVDAPIWASELSALAGPYIESLNQELGEVAVKSIRFSVSRRTEQDRLHHPTRQGPDVPEGVEAIEPVPLTEVERAQVEASTATIPDEQLREAVVRATVVGMEWEKGRRAASKAQKPRDGL